MKVKRFESGVNKEFLLNLYFTYGHVVKCDQKITEH